MFSRYLLVIKPVRHRILQPCLQFRKFRSVANLGSSTPEMSGKNPGNVIGGHKATLSDPHRSEEAKQHSKQVLDEQFGGGEGVGGNQGAATSTEKNSGNVIGGYKATLSNPTTGSGAKAKAKKKLNEMGVEVDDT
ncbi:hypothetical protein EV426DRAFT_585827 [Tirmania nivea]|nr:hypothetical protein EV426DRAFT_585827 [Tirmania nivea]